MNSSKKYSTMASISQTKNWFRVFWKWFPAEYGVLSWSHLYRISLLTVFTCTGMVYSWFRWKVIDEIEFLWLWSNAYGMPAIRSYFNGLPNSRFFLAPTATPATWLHLHYQQRHRAYLVSNKMHTKRTNHLKTSIFSRKMTKCGFNCAYRPIYSPPYRRASCTCCNYMPAFRINFFVRQLLCKETVCGVWALHLLN